MKNFVIITTSVIFIACTCILFTIISEYKSFNKTSVEYQLIVTDDVITVYDGNQTVGTVKLEGELNNLLTDYNE